MRFVQTVMRLIDRKSDQDQGVFLYSSVVRIIPIICALGGRTRGWLNHRAYALFAVQSFFPARTEASVECGGVGDESG